MTKVDRDNYYVIYTKMPSGFECKIPARGYNLKSWLAFEDKLNATYYYEQTTKEVYEHLVFGDPDAILDTEDDDERRSETETQQKTPTKRNSRKATDKDSKGDGDKPKRASSVRKAKPSELRKPEVHAVRKPKKTVARTNNSGKAITPRNGNRKTKTQ